MRNFALVALVAGSMAMATSSLTFADDEFNNNNRDAGYDHRHYKTLKVGLWGDEFYSNDEAEKTLQIDQTINSMNKHRLDFTMFAGDTKNGSSFCTDEAIGQDVIDIFNSLNAPTLYSLGDNEWTDCHRTNNDSYDPLERLAYLRETFFNKNC